MDANTVAAAPITVHTISNHLTQIVTAVGGLGVAAYGLVDVSKSMFGGVSTRGFTNIAKVLATLVPEIPVADAGKVPTSEPTIPPPLSLQSILITLKSNWINGVASQDQRAIAKTMVKLRLNAASAGLLAQVTGVDPMILAQVAGKIGGGQPLTQIETDVYGRFDLVLTTMLDQVYQRADQQYRNTAKAAAVLVAVVLAVGGSCAVGMYHLREIGVALLLGLMATPLAPVAKDVSSAIQSGAKVAQAWNWRK